MDFAKLENAATFINASGLVRSILEALMQSHGSELNMVTATSGYLSSQRGHMPEIPAEAFARNGWGVIAFHGSSISMERCMESWIKGLPKVQEQHDLRIKLRGTRMEGIERMPPSKHRSDRPAMVANKPTLAPGMRKTAVIPGKLTVTRTYDGAAGPSEFISRRNFFGRGVLL